MPSMPATLLPLLAAGAPLLLAATALFLPADPRAAARVAPAAAWAAFALALATATGVAAGAGSHAVLARAADDGPLAALSLSVHLDALSATMLLLVSFVGAIVTRYARRYLDGNAGQARFSRWLLLTLGAVLTLVLAGNLALLAAAWIATSLALHRLLVFYPEREAAQLAARKKFVFGRLADACLVAAVVLAADAFGGVELDTVLGRARDAAAAGAPIAHAHWIAALLALAAVIKSAQFPFHGWLPEVMETPTPVSALLHAGIINAGGFLLVRTSPLLALSAPSLDALVLVGGFTALFAAAVMLTQSSVKVSLAWSTCAQMGFMLLQCGLGAFSTAVLHIVAHSLYKAHAFLGAGSIVDAMRAQAPKGRPAAPSPSLLALAAAGALALTATVAAAQWALTGASPAAHPGAIALGAILTIGVTQLLLQGLASPPRPAAAARVAGLAAAACAAWFVLSAGARALLSDAVAQDVALRGAASAALPALVVLAFAAALVLQAMLPARMDSPRWRAAYVHLLNGWYVNARVDRWLRRAWPLPTAAR